MSIVVNVENRDSNSRSELKKLRERGLVPASVSGKKIPPVSIAIDEKELLHLLRGHSHEILEMDIPQQGRQSVMLKDVQRDKIVPGRLLHVDFHQISMDDPIKTEVPIELIGEPVGVGEGGFLQPMLSEIEVKALPKQLPSSIEVDVSHLGIGDKIVVADLQLPERVELLEDPTTLVATVLQVRKTTEAEEGETVSEAEDAQEETPVK